MGWVRWAWGRGGGGGGGLGRVGSAASGKGVGARRRGAKKKRGARSALPVGGGRLDHEHGLARVAVEGLERHAAADLRLALEEARQILQVEYPFEVVPAV